jgi:RNA polymerase sigma factor (sigma-70 family)
MVLLQAANRTPAASRLSMREALALSANSSRSPGPKATIYGLDERTPEEAHSAGELLDRVRAAVAGLPPGQCQVITLVDREGFSCAEVAEMAGIPVGTVMSRLSRARGAMREVLAELQQSARPKSEVRLVRVK